MITWTGRIGALALVLAIATLVTGCPSETPNPTPDTAGTAEGGDTGGGGEGGGDSGGSDGPPPPPPAPEEPPFDRATAESPYSKAKVGDWAKVSIPSFGIMQHWEVSEVGDDFFIMKRFRLGDDGAKELIEDSRVELAKPERDWQDPRTRDAVTEVKEDVAHKIGDREVKVLIVIRETSLGKTETWYLMDVAINNGVVKSIKDDSVNLEIVDFGSK